MSIEGVYMTIQIALNAANASHQNNIDQGIDAIIKLKIASNLYDLNGDPLYISIPNIIIEPKEKGGEVTL